MTGTAPGGLVFAVGLIGGLVGFMTEAFPSSVGVIVMPGAWLIGGALAALSVRRKAD